eukprot:8021674-Pyramimonas_sp.AAC.1
MTDASAPRPPGSADGQVEHDGGKRPPHRAASRSSPGRNAKQQQVAGGSQDHLQEPQERRAARMAPQAAARQHFLRRPV